MTRKATRHLFTALTAAAAIGIFSWFGTTEANAQQTTAVTAEEEDTTSDLDSLRQAIADMLAALDAIQAELAVFRQEREEAQRKSLTPRLPLGLSRSTAEPFYSRRPRDDEVICAAIGCAPDAPLADLLLFETRLFAPLTSTLKRTFSGDQRGSTLTDDFYVKTISGDGADGLNVTYVAGGEERSVQFEADDFDTEDCPGCYYEEDEEGRGHWFWKSGDVVAYADVYGGSFPGGNRHYFIFGARTESASLPAASASYFGRVYAQAYKKDDPDNDQRVEMNGRIVLTADLDESTLDGVIRQLWSRPRGGQWSGMSDTSAHFNITGGRIVDGQFTATLTGMGDKDVEADDTVLGYKGGILGEFYGPAAEEVGGVVSASSDAHNRVLFGYFSGEQLNSTSSDELPAQSMALFVDRPESTVSIIGTAGVTGVKRDGAGGFHVTYTLGDEEQTVHLEATDLGSYSGFPTTYHERVENRSYFLWDATNSFYNDPEFDHFNVNGWAMTDWADAGHDFAASTSRGGYVAHGTRTETDDLPTGAASYSGRAWVEILPADDTASSARSHLRGDLALNANFGADTVGGSISWNEKRDPGQSSYQTTSRRWTMGNGTISDNRFTADLTESGDAGTDVDMVGHFYGPAAAEAGGVLSGTLSDGDDVVRGWFGGTKQ